MRAQHDEIDRVFLHHRREIFPGESVADVAVVRNVTQKRRHLLQLSFGLVVGVFVDGSHADVIHAPGHHQQPGIAQHMGEMEGAAKTGADGGRIRESRFGGGGKIGREKHVLDRDDTSGFPFRNSGFGMAFDECHGTPPTLTITITPEGGNGVGPVSPEYVIGITEVFRSPGATAPWKGHVFTRAATAAKYGTSKTRAPPGFLVVSGCLAFSYFLLDYSAKPSACVTAPIATV